MAQDVFISHSSRDRIEAEATCQALESRGISCWMAPRNIRPGADWSESIIDALSQAKVMVVIISHHANDSQQLRREVERGSNRGMMVIPMRIENVPPARSLEYFLSTSHWLDAFPPPIDRHLEILVETVASTLEEQRRRENQGTIAPPVVPPTVAPVVQAPPQPQPRARKRRRARSLYLMAAGLGAGVGVLILVAVKLTLLR
jgi:TIR domain